MTSKITNAFYQPRSDIWKGACEILLPNSGLINSNPLQLNDITEELFLEHFQEFFTYYNEEAICNNRHVGINENSSIQPTDNDLWIFGYGSLVWKADFSYIDKKQGFIEGYQRRFFQHSIDHRGTHEKPGRVVTLVPTKDNSGRVYGVAYRIASSEKDEVLAHLDFREKNGYQRCMLKFNEFSTDESFDIIMYIATEENESFAGGDENDLQPIAEQIYLSAGPSGPNREYLYNLAHAMRELFPGVDDDHLYKLERMVKMREKRDQKLAEAVKARIRGLFEEGTVEEVMDRFNSLKEEVRMCMALPQAVWTSKK